MAPKRSKPCRNPILPTKKKLEMGLKCPKLPGKKPARPVAKCRSNIRIRKWGNLRKMGKFDARNRKFRPVGPVLGLNDPFSLKKYMHPATAQQNGGGDQPLITRLAKMNERPIQKMLMTGKGRKRHEWGVGTGLGERRKIWLSPGVTKLQPKMTQPVLWDNSSKKKPTNVRYIVATSTKTIFGPGKMSKRPDMTWFIMCFWCKNRAGDPFCGILRNFAQIPPPPAHGIREGENMRSEGPKNYAEIMRNYAELCGKYAENMRKFWNLFRGLSQNFPAPAAPNMSGLHPVPLILGQRPENLRLLW
jgi:hypothetical protein